MTASSLKHDRPYRRGVVGALLARPRLTISMCLGLVVGLGCQLLFPGLRPSTCAIFGWDTTCVVFIVAVLSALFGEAPSRIRDHAASQDEGRGFILALVTIAAAASLFAIGAELSLAKADHGWLKAGRVLLAVLTVAGSWFVVQLIFTLHYAHEYYAARHGPTGPIAGGLTFPGEESPDYWDFLHFAVVIGVASQTADIAFTSRPLRRVGTIHSVLAFTFNTVVLALTINLVAGLF